MLARIQTVYDVMYDLKGFSETGAFTLLYADVVYSVDINQRHSDHVVTATIKYKTVNTSPGVEGSGQNKMISKAYPDNGYTQLISREVSVAELITRSINPQPNLKINFWIEWHLWKMKRKYDLREELQRSFNDWERIILQPALKRAAGEIKFPGINYYSNW